MSLYLSMQHFHSQNYCGCYSDYAIFANYRQRQRITHFTLILQILIMQKQSRRNQIREKLKGTLSAWKLIPDASRGKKCVAYSDRSPVPGVTNELFEDMFDIQSKIGQGSSGTVHVCRSKQEGKQYAVKIARGGQQMLRIAKKQFKILQSIQHPNVIKPKCLFLNQVTQKIYIVLEYLPFPSLEKLYRKLEDDEKNMIIKTMLEILSHLHSKGICHRDIKLENILYDQATKKLKLIDFGVSKKNSFIDKENVEKMWTCTGSLQYMAPEMFMGTGYDTKVDCWAVGVLAYKIYFYKFPFDSDYKSSLIEMITSKEPEYPQQDILLTDFLKHLLKKNIRQRLSCYDALNHPWIENQALLKKRFSIQQQSHEAKRYSETQLKEKTNIPKQQVIQRLRQTNIFENKKHVHTLPEDFKGVGFQFR